MRSGTKIYLLLSIFICLTTVLLISGCTKSSSIDGGGSFCGPNSIVFSADGTAYLLGFNQLFATNPQGNITIDNYTVPNYLGAFSDMVDISNDGNIWDITTDLNNSPTILTIFNSQGYFVTQLTTDFSSLSSVKISPSTDISWIGGYTGYTITSNGVVYTKSEPRLEALSISGQSLTSFTLPTPSISSFNARAYVRLAISSNNDIVWSWSPGYLSGYSFTGLVYGPYPVNMVESSDQYQIGCGSINKKWIIVNPITNAIWMGNSATTTVLALLPDGTVQFQKNLDINISTMAVSLKTGNVWIGSNNKIDVLDPSGNIIKLLTLKNLNCITYMAISPVDNTVWIGNETNMSNTEKNIIILDANGNIVNSFYVPVMCVYPSM